MKRLLVWLAMLLLTLALTQETMAAESWRCGRPAASASSLIAKWLQSKPGALERHGESRRLAVLLHAYTSDSGHMADTCEVLLDAYGSDTDVLMPDLPFGVFSTQDPYVVVADLIKQVDDAWEAKEKSGSPYEDVVLVGHSIGSLFVRKLYVAASGETADAPFEPALVNRLTELQASDIKKPRKWAAATERVILLAGLNSGWTISHHMTPLRGIAFSAGLWLGRVVHDVSGRNLIIMSAHRGAPFITQLRLQWLAMRAKQKATGGTPSGAKVVQLLGTIDDLVPPDDNVDPVTGSDFVYLDVPFTNHVNITKMDSHEEHGVRRAEAFKRALIDNNLAPGIGAPVAVTEYEVRRPEPDVTDVVFVVHGIRDEGYWTEKIARRVLQLSDSLKNATPSRKIAIVTAGYGYFPMLSFLRPGARQEKVEWLMDQYTRAKARYPNAAFSFVGHSNGTYLLAKALHEYPAVKFKNVLFACRQRSAHRLRLGFVEAARRRCFQRAGQRRLGGRLVPSCARDRKYAGRGRRRLPGLYRTWSNPNAGLCHRRTLERAGGGLVGQHCRIRASWTVQPASKRACGRQSRRLGQHSGGGSIVHLGRDCGGAWLDTDMVAPAPHQRVEANARSRWLFVAGVVRSDGGVEVTWKRLAWPCRLCGRSFDFSSRSGA